MDFTDKIAVVTGAASGIGRGIVARCLDEGMIVVAADIDAETLDAAYGAMAARVHQRVVDVSDAAAMQTFADNIFDRFGGVHLLFNNAGVMKTGTVWEHSDADWQWMLGVNLFGVINGVRAFVPRMIEADEPARVINTGSIAGLTPTPTSAIYCVSKHGVVSLSESLYYELKMAKAQVGVSVVCPGPVQTNITKWDRYDQAADEADEAGLVAYSQDKLQKLIDKQGMPVDELADHIFSAIKQDRFWVLPHDHFKPAFEARMQSVLTGQNPQFRSSVKED